MSRHKSIYNKYTTWCFTVNLGADLTYVFCVSLMATSLFSCYYQHRASVINYVLMLVFVVSALLYVLSPNNTPNSK